MTITYKDIYNAFSLTQRARGCDPPGTHPGSDRRSSEHYCWELPANSNTLRANGNHWGKHGTLVFDGSTFDYALTSYGINSTKVAVLGASQLYELTDVLGVVTVSVGEGGGHWYFTVHDRMFWADLLRALRAVYKRLDPTGKKKVINDITLHKVNANIDSKRY